MRRKVRLRWFRAMAAIGLATCSVASAAKSILHPGQMMAPGETIESANGRYQATFQGDGNLVVYRKHDGVAIWATWTHGSGAAKAIMQTDGNFVLYTGAGVPVWSTGTQGRDRVFGVSDWGLAMVVKVKKWVEGSSVDSLIQRGSKRSWVAEASDERWRPRPSGPHCIGDPRACGPYGNRRF